jgi:phosphatidylinositol-3-phosphatase
MRRLRGVRVTLGQLALVSAASAAVSVLIVVSALGQTGTERAVIAALRTRQVISAPRPAATRQASPPSAVGPVTAAAPTPAPVTPASSGGSDTGEGGGTAAPAASSDEDDSSGDDASSSGLGTATSADNSDTTAGGGTAAGGTAPSKPASKVKHVFVIVLAAPSYASAFGHESAAHYLNAELRPKGVLLSEYHTLGTSALPDLLATISGQAPNLDTAAGCPTYSEFPSGASPRANGLVPGAGCIYPDTALTLGDQMDGANLTWRGYIEGMTAPCQHPNSGASDQTADDEYATDHNPFVYFHSLLDLGDCQSDDVPYGRLAGALRSAHRTPNFAFISPDPCDSGDEVTCAAGQPGGIVAADDFLKQSVPGILRSSAYRKSGALLILFTAAPVTGQTADSPVRTGALVLSPFAKAGSTNRRSYDPYSVLRSVEDIFGLSALGRAKSAHPFAAKILAGSAR